MKVTLDQTSIDALKSVLNQYTDKPRTIRIHFSGNGCSGPSFGLALDEQNKNDIECKVEGLRFIMDKFEYSEYGDIVIEDTGYGFRVYPENIENFSGGCSSCSGSCGI